MAPALAFPGGFFWRDWGHLGAEDAEGGISVQIIDRVGCHPMLTESHVLYTCGEDIRSISGHASRVTVFTVSHSETQSDGGDGKRGITTGVSNLKS